MHNTASRKTTSLVEDVRGVRPIRKLSAPAVCILVVLISLGSLASCQRTAEQQEGNADKPRVEQGSLVASPDEWVSQQSEFLQIADGLEHSENPYLGTRQIAIVRQQLARPGLTPSATAKLSRRLWSNHLRLGDVDAAVRVIDGMMEMSRSFPDLPPGVLAQLHEDQAITYLRKAEVVNCIEQHNRDCCIFPLREGGIHRTKDPANEARKGLLKTIELRPDDLATIWLLNLVSMAIGDYPEGIPQRYLIPPDAFNSEYEMDRFPDIAPLLGLNNLDLCGGVIIEDFDGDEMLDIVTSTYDPRGPLSHYRNLANGTFRNEASDSRLADQLGGLNCIGSDYDGDGDFDILVLRGAWLLDDGQIRNSLIRNNGNGTFSDVTRQAGLVDPARPTQAAAWGDFDLDGDLDLYIGNESRFRAGAKDGDYPSQLFRNNGDGTFTDIAAQAGVTNDRYAKGVTAGDFDNDGDLDIYVSNVGPNRLYRNQGDGTFADVAVTLGIAGPEVSFATWFFDYNNDGWLDLFVAAYNCTIADIAADYLGRPHTGVSPALYRNDGKGNFTDVTESVGLNHPYLPMGANFGDLDYDGYLDIYLATGRPNFRSLMPNIMLRNDRGQRYQDVTSSGGFGHLQKGHGVAFADVDNDGDQDVYHQLGGFYPGDRYHNVLFQNPGHNNRFVVVRLIGTATNRSAIGARVRVVVETPDGTQMFHRAVGSVSSFGGSPLRQEIGLGSATRIDRVEIDWPNSANTQVVRNVPLDSLIKVTEGVAEFERQPFDALVGPK